jgi:hypothetical protein
MLNSSAATHPIFRAFPYIGRESCKLRRFGAGAARVQSAARHFRWRRITVANIRDALGATFLARRDLRVAHPFDIVHIPIELHANINEFVSVVNTEAEMYLNKPVSIKLSTYSLSLSLSLSVCVCL